MRREVSKGGLSGRKADGSSNSLADELSNYGRNMSLNGKLPRDLDYVRVSRNGKKYDEEDVLAAAYSGRSGQEMHENLNDTAGAFSSQVRHGSGQQLHHLHHIHADNHRGSHRSNNEHYSSNSDEGSDKDKPHLHHQQQQPPHSTSHQHSDAQHILTMLIDGVGLAMVAGATLLEGVVLWKAFFHEYWHTHTLSLGFWFLGRFCQVFGLMLLIAFAASFDTLTAVEYAGMTLITIGPVFNTIASVLFDAKNDPLFLFNKAWRTNEFIEFCGMALLDISYIKMSDIAVLLTEWSGFCVLICAATMEFEYFPTTPIPRFEVRYDLVHGGEAAGLMFLMVVAYIQYRERIVLNDDSPPAQNNPHSSAHSHQQKQQQRSHQQVAQLHHRRSISPPSSSQQSTTPTSNEVLIV